MASFTIVSGGARLEVTDADDCETIADGFALFRDVLNLPENATVLVDGEPVDDLDISPEDGAEVAVNRPTGQKG